MATLSVFAARFSGEEVAMRFAVDISPAGRWGAPVLLAELAALAEDSGWDGVFCEDYLAFADRLDTYDVWITLGLMASATQRVTLASIVTPLAWRQTMDGRGSGDHSRSHLSRTLRAGRWYRRQRRW
jgi:hypothetical protein